MANAESRNAETQTPDAIDDGGSAFPRRVFLCDASGAFAGFQDEGGMSLRDYFAARAMQGIKANPELLRICSEVEGMTQAEAIAHMAYVDADAMIAEMRRRSAQSSKPTAEGCGTGEEGGAHVP